MPASAVPSRLLTVATTSPSEPPCRTTKIRGCSMPELHDAEFIGGEPRSGRVEVRDSIAVCVTTSSNFASDAFLR